MYSEYYNDPANPNIPSWRMVRTATAKYIQTYNATGAVIAREYYNLISDPAENTNLLGDCNTSQRPAGHHDPASHESAQRLRHLRRGGVREVARRLPRPPRRPRDP